MTENLGRPNAPTLGNPPTLTFSDYASFIGAALPDNPAAYQSALDALTAPYQVIAPGDYPPGNGPGGLNNTDAAGMAMGRYRVAKASQDAALRDNAHEYAVGWMRCYKAQNGSRDGGHRFLDGLLAIALENVPESQEALDVLIEHGHGYARANLERYERTDWGGVRYVTRELANAMIAGWALEHLRGDPVGSKECYDTAKSATKWFLNRRFERPADDYRGEVDGWGETDDPGSPVFLGDKFDRESVYWSEIGSPSHIPYQSFSTAYRAFLTVEQVVESSSAGWGAGLLDGLRAARVNLAEHFWEAGYFNSENPLIRGTGDTYPHAICFDSKGGEPLKLAFPDELGVNTGAMLYPYWHMSGLWDTLAGMFEATVMQCARSWPDMLPLMLFDADLLRKVEAWRDEVPPPEPEPSPGQRLKECYRLLKREGYPREAELFRGTTEAYEDYYKANTED